MMDLAALRARLAADLRERLPETKRAVAHGKLRVDGQAPALQVSKQILPGLLGFANPSLSATSFFWPSDVAPMTTSTH